MVSEENLVKLIRMVLVTIIRKRAVEVLFEARRDNVKVVFLKGVRCVVFLR